MTTSKPDQDKEELPPEVQIKAPEVGKRNKLSFLSDYIKKYVEKKEKKFSNKQRIWILSIFSIFYFSFLLSIAYRTFSSVGKPPAAKAPEAKEFDQSKKDQGPAKKQAEDEK